MRQIILDTETTGFNAKQGDRIVEIGCVEMIGRKLTGRTYHQYINPERDMPEDAFKVHGISAEFLADKPVFAQIADEFYAFIEGAELIAHNATFDVNFIDEEFAKFARAGNTNYGRAKDYCQITDTLAMAKEKHPGQKNSLDALCRRYFIDNSHRDLHGALLDAEILADVYLFMTGGQTDLVLDEGSDESKLGSMAYAAYQGAELKVIRSTAQEQSDHDAFMKTVEKAAGQSVWSTLE